MRNHHQVTGLKKVLFNLVMQTAVFFRYLGEFARGRLKFSEFAALIRRLLYFVSRLQHNKFVNINGCTRMDLYIPGFPGRAFDTACDKFRHFEGKLPCTTVLISVTSGCRFHCEHCYQRLDKGQDLELGLLTATVKKLQDSGIAFFNVEGGEPFLVYDRLKAVCGVIDDRSEIWINSTGDGMTLERLHELKRLNTTAVMFSLHSHRKEELNRFMGSDQAWDTMARGVELCHQAGIAVTFNVCLQKPAFYNGDFEAVMETAKTFGAALIQLIHPKSAGAWLTEDVNTFSNDDLKHIENLVNRYNHSLRFRSYPSVSAQIIEENRSHFGCTAGGTDRFYINAKGDVQPCEFLNISFGNIAREGFEPVYAKMRHAFEAAGDCWLCQKYTQEIRSLMSQNQLDRLPLPPELTDRLVAGWNRGDKTPLYHCLEKEIKP